MHLSMAIGMEQEQVRKIVRSTINPVDNVMNMPSRFFGDFLVTDWTFSFLPSPESNQLSPVEPALKPLESNPFIKVGFVGWVIRISLPLDKPMPPNGGGGCFLEVDGQSFPFLSFYFSGKHPFSFANNVKVFIFHPSSPFGRVPSLCPLPQRLEDRAIHFVEGSLACHMSVIQGPSPNNRVQLNDELSCWGLFVFLHDFSDFLLEVLYAAFGWLDEKLSL